MGGLIIAYQEPSGGITSGIDLVMGSENDEDFGSHFGGFCSVKFCIEY
jgi:hypothetical protein